MAAGGERQATNWYDGSLGRGTALRYGVCAALVVAAAASAAELLTLYPDGPIAAAAPDAVMVDLPPALASALPPNEAPDGPSQEAMPATPTLPPPSAEHVVERPVEVPPPPEAPHPDAVIEKVEEAAPVPPPPPVATAAQEEMAPAGADAAKAVEAEGDIAAAAPDAHAITAWQRAMVGRLETAKHRNPHHQHLSGTVDVAFRIDRLGHLADRAVKRSSGNGALDAIALALVADASPFPVPPPGLGDAGLSFTVPIRFNPRR